jgi:poly(3-hydroxybutyrate) depolymerase
MRKLRLNLEALDVQSFDTAAKGGRLGTVMAASDPETFDAGCSVGGPCTGTCTEATHPVPLCASYAGEVCPESPTGPPCA